MKTCCCFPVLTQALPFALRTHNSEYIPLNPWGASPLAHAKHGGMDSSATPVRWWPGSAGLVSLCQDPAPPRDTVLCSRVIFPLATSPLLPLPRPGGPWKDQVGLLPCPSPVSSGADTDERPFPSALLRDAPNPGRGWLPARPPEGPGGWLSSLLFFQRLQKAARPHLIQIY